MASRITSPAILGLDALQAGLAAKRCLGVVPGSGHAVHLHSPALVGGAILDLISWGK